MELNGSKNKIKINKKIKDLSKTKVNGDGKQREIEHINTHTELGLL